MASSLNGLVAVVTGASSGIGRAVGYALGENGAQLCLIARRRALLESLANDVAELSPRSYVCRTDLTNNDELHTLADSVQREFCRVDILVLCGGLMFHERTEQASLDEFDLQYRSNLRAHYALIQLMLPSLRKSQGQIVFINSSSGVRQASAGEGQYAAFQHGLRAVADSLRDEVNGDGVRVLSVYPGRTATPRMEALYAERGLPYHPEALMQPEDVAGMVIAALNLPRSCEVTEISMRPMLKTY